MNRILVLGLKWLPQLTVSLLVAIILERFKIDTIRGALLIGALWCLWLMFAKPCLIQYLWQFREPLIYVTIAFVLGYGWYYLWIPVEVRSARQIFLEMSKRIERLDGVKVLRGNDGGLYYVDKVSNVPIAEEQPGGGRSYRRSSGELFATVVATGDGVEVSYYDGERPFLRDYFNAQGHPTLAEYDPQRRGDRRVLLSSFPFFLPILPVRY